MNTTGQVPSSAYDLTGGLVYFARMLDKIRVHSAGRLRADFHTNLGDGFDGRCCWLLGVDYAELCERVVAGGTDEELFEWCQPRGSRLTAEQILVWNKFMVKRGWRDEDDGSTREFEDCMAASGLAHHTDIVTFFDYHEVDEGRRP